jgi:hypothetical protein
MFYAIPAALLHVSGGHPSKLAQSGRLGVSALSWRRVTAATEVTISDHSHLVGVKGFIVMTRFQ